MHFFIFTKFCVSHWRSIEDRQEQTIWSQFLLFLQSLETQIQKDVWAGGFHRLIPQNSPSKERGQWAMEIQILIKDTAVGF